jgi:hypothetical protein
VLIIGGASFTCCSPSFLFGRISWSRGTFSLCWAHSWAARLKFSHREVDLSYWRASSLSVDHTISFGGAISLVGQVIIRLGLFS